MIKLSANATWFCFLSYWEFNPHWRLGSWSKAGSRWTPEVVLMDVHLKTNGIMGIQPFRPLHILGITWNNPLWNIAGIWFANFWTQFPLANFGLTDSGGDLPGAVKKLMVVVMMKEMWRNCSYFLHLSLIAANPEKKETCFQLFPGFSHNDVTNCYHLLRGFRLFCNFLGLRIPFAPDRSSLAGHPPVGSSADVYIENLYPKSWSWTHRNSRNMVEIW
jgi:hypothetical protein